MDDSEYTNDDYTVAWICALDVELAAAQGMLDQEHAELPVSEQDTNTYILGKICQHNVVITGLPAGTPGTNSVAIAATNLLRSFKKIRFGLMVGVGGGAPGDPSADPLEDIRLGDVVVSTPSGIHGGVIQYDFGKTIQSKGPATHSKGQSKTFIRAGSLNRPPTVLITAVTKLRARARLKGYRIDSYLNEMLANFPDAAFGHPDGHIHAPSSEDRLFSSEYIHRGGQADCEHCDLAKLIKRRQRPTKRSAVHYGLIGSGNQVVRNANVRDRLRKREGVICFEMEAAGLMNDFPCLIIRGICDYCDSHKNKLWQPYAAAVAASYTKELLSIVLPLAVSKTQPASEFVAALQTHTKILSQQIHTVANDIGTKLDLAGLPYVAGATFNSYIDADDLDTVCMKETRVDVLKAIRLWIHSAQTKCVFWLNGMAGTGKSTIARTVATELKENSLLAASFFFKRGERDRGGTSRFFPTIAWQLYKTYSSIRDHIRHAMEIDPHIADRSLEDQFRHLIFRPLEAIANDLQTPVVLIIDALDECKPESHVILLIDLLARLVSIQDLQVRIFLTSRPELAPREGFHNLTTINYKDIILHDIAPEIVEQDIALYLRTRLKHIRAQHNDSFPLDWPGESKIQKLIAMATPLFIYAATICRFLGDPYQNPDMRLLSLVQDYDLEAYDKIHRMYEPILNRLLSETTKREQEGLFQDFQVIVGTIVTLAESLSVIDLAALLKIDEKHIAMRLKGLHSVLRIPKDEALPVKILHKSFRDFLLDRDRHKEHQFWIDEEATHRMLAAKSLDTLMQIGTLRQNMLNVEDSGATYSSIGQKSNQLPSHVRYACRYWVYHLYRGQSCTSNNMAKIHKFLQQHYIHLFEALALCGYASEMIDMMSTLQELALKCGNTEWINFFSDADRFAIANAGMVQEAPSQLYSSALIFAPLESTIRLNFIHLKPSWITRLPDVPRTWAPLLHTLSNGNHHVASFAFSENDEQVLLCSKNGTATLWSSVGGILEQKFIFPVIETDFPRHVVSSPQSNTIIFLKASKNTYHIEIRNLTQGTLLHTLPIMEKSIGAFAGISMCLSPDGGLLCCTRNHIQIWGVHSGVLQGEIQLHSRASAVVFSSDSKLLGYYLNDKTLGILDVTSGALQWQFHPTQHHSEPAKAVLSIIESRFLVYGALYDPVELWDFTTHKLWHEFSTIQRCRALATAQDGSLLAIGEMHRISLCVPASREIYYVLDIHNELVVSLAFSPQGRYIAANIGRDVKLWEVAHAPKILSEAAVSMPLQYRQSIPFQDGAAHSSDHRWTIMIPWNTFGHLFRIAEGKLDFGSSVGGSIQKAVISPDRTFIITGHSDEQLEIWESDPDGKLVTNRVADDAEPISTRCFGLSSDGSAFEIDMNELSGLRGTATGDAFVDIRNLQFSLLQTTRSFRCILISIALTNHKDALAVAWLTGGISIFWPYYPRK